MSLATIRTLLSATAFAAQLLPLTTHLIPLIVQLGHTILAFKSNPITPAATHDFECQLAQQLREGGRVIMQAVLNDLEADVHQAAPEVVCERDFYRRRTRSPRRHGLATLFGIITFWRLRYEPCDAGVGLACIFPLEQRLGLCAGKATPALASRLGSWTAQHTQETVRSLLQEEHQVAWSVDTLRQVVAELSAGLAPLTQEAQVERLLDLLRQAQDSKGGHRPVLTVGRDGIFVPICKDTKYREAATATVAVLDRAGKRLGTVYLGHMPEAGQKTLSQQLTDLLLAVLERWSGPWPRLQYVTDGGHHPSEYFATVLQRMRHPRTGQVLAWEWVVDYYHACLYITKLAEALFGKQTKAAASWAAKRRRWLKDKKGGINRVLHSAAAHAWRMEFSVAEKKAYDDAYGYLQQRQQFMAYQDYRRRGLAIGSGITEAGCKTLFTQRFKQSGMKWSLEGGQVVVDLRVLWISKLWRTVYKTYIQQLPQALETTKDTLATRSYELAA